MGKGKMMSKPEVTEQDIRLPQFRDAKLEDLEFDASGEVVRKDRFEKSMRTISSRLHGINGLSARSSWTCEQVVEAVKITITNLTRLKELTIALNSFPDGAEFYHPENKTYIKNIDQEHLEEARKEPDLSHLINHETLDVNDSNKWKPDSGFLEYIDVLLSTEDIKKEILKIAGEIEYAE